MVYEGNKNNTLFIVAEIDGKIIGNLNFSGGSKKRIAHTGEFGVNEKKILIIVFILFITI
ncbi:hypothetical protein [Tepidibacter formicigenes]|uniref:Uncharacterized protein n=1 Tax=Tepidibacter formicigenes DSM 15518 TaxID=1123349 RepID=A0A1M6LIH3_9FIRM|nr:hypothetical protein [Tepidibacter formicigenes]SHJ70993.1 hypothetical protein SAMN02744037_00646 [Tepidibacter formicigenes DSM 15518]